MSQLIASTVLVAMAIVLAEVRRLGVGRELAVGAVRSFLQLMAEHFKIPLCQPDAESGSPIMIP